MDNLNKILILSNCLILTSAILIPEHLKAHHQSRNLPQKCNLICPGQQPLPLPSNFLQNSVCVSTTTSTSTTPKSTTKNTTTESSSEEETTESSEEVTTERKAKHRLRQRKNKYSKLTNSQHKGKNKVRKETVILKRQAKSHIFKHNKSLKDAKLDGCSVICSDDTSSAVPDTSESGSDESDDNYVGGEGTPIEIIYIPAENYNNNKPSDVYQINNYELIDPDPYMGSGYYDSWLRQGKRKKINKKKKKQLNKKAHNKNKISKVKSIKSHQ